MHQRFEVVFDYSQIGINDARMERPYNDWSRVHVEQGFTWRPSSVSFGTLFGGGLMHVEVRTTEQLQVSADAVRAIRVPFTVPDHGEVEIGFTTSTVVHLPAGQHDLLFEMGGATAEDQWCRFSLAPPSDQPATILRQDAELHPPPQLEMDAEPA